MLLLSQHGQLHETMRAIVVLLFFGLPSVVWAARAPRKIPPGYVPNRPTPAGVPYVPREVCDAGTMLVGIYCERSGVTRSYHVSCAHLYPSGRRVVPARIDRLPGWCPRDHVCHRHGALTVRPGFANAFAPVRHIECVPSPERHARCRLIFGGDEDDREPHGDREGGGASASQKDPLLDLFGPKSNGKDGDQQNNAGEDDRSTWGDDLTLGSSSHANEVAMTSGLMAADVQRPDDG